MLLIRTCQSADVRDNKNLSEVSAMFLSFYLNFSILFQQCSMGNNIYINLFLSLLQFLSTALLSSK